MVKLDVTLLRYLTKDDFRVLTEWGRKVKIGNLEWMF